MNVQTYLSFNGRCEEAIEFYKKTLGAQVLMMMRFKESPMPADQMPAGSENKIMHSSLKIGDATVMASDGQCQGTAAFQGFSLVLSAKDEAEANSLFAKLSEGGQVKMPISKTFFSPAYGILTDKFGVGWMVMVASQAASA